MLEMLVYPVSAVMKFWHWLLAGVLHMPADSAWLASIVLLVFTVRGIILPFAWQTYKVSRKTFLMRPHLNRITEQYGTSTDPDDIAAEDAARKALNKEYNYNPLAACVPALIQMPVFLGLYRLLLWLAVPSAAAGRRLGVLSDAEIASFRSTTLFGVPLPAYVSMSEEQFEFLGTTLADVRSLALPLLIAAIVLTSSNLMISQMRNRTTLEWENAVTRKSYYFIYWMIPLAAAGLAIAGLTGLVPIALMMYWVLNNLFTTTQNLAFWFWAVKKYPAEDIHRESQRKAHAEAMEEQREKRERKRATRRKRVNMVIKPHRALHLHREIRGEKRARKDEKASKKAERKRLNKERGEARKELNRRRAEEKKRQKAGASASSVRTIEGSTRWEPTP